jgi:1-aminocyclopropane-1-carboxylate deaminase
MNLKRFARHSLTFGPTPIQPLKRLSAHLGGKVELYAKREDCNSGLAFGGNKTRKLEYLIPDALAQGCDTLVSIGGIQSNQTPGRSRGRAPGTEVRAGAGELGQLCRCRI